MHIILGQPQIIMKELFVMMITLEQLVQQVIAIGLVTLCHMKSVIILI